MIEVMVTWSPPICLAMSPHTLVLATTATGADAAFDDDPALDEFDEGAGDEVEPHPAAIVMAAAAMTTTGIRRQG
ncbi:hypothetical protein MMAD_11900 [Mycolicibacterium madagascariense]|uniref:Uncharacterized protein n=1 Tax=Mycolicibacterium madagascariense TaxID=212765 RepID=A0A7I7XC39_9MYCO|nr:hypothetical protein [Mycolicibacterium madagascariense]BBZ26895.1 hypothetical protein MMAD_11900 [Mycolicibacterium madagascariense]